MEEKIYIKDSPYLPIRDAAHAVKFTSDYIARLCRKGKVKAQRVGKNWYVDESSLKEFAAREEKARDTRHQRLAAQYARNRDRSFASTKVSVGENAALSASAATPNALYESLLNALQKKNVRAAPVVAASATPGMFGRVGAAAFAVCLMSAAWTWCAPPSARALAGDFLQTTGTAAHEALESNPQHIALALENAFAEIVAPIQNAAVALGDIELNGAAQVGGAFTGYSSVLASDRPFPASGELAFAVPTKALGIGSLFPPAQVAISNTSPTQSSGPTTPGVVYKQTTVVQNADLLNYVTQDNLAAQISALQNSFAQFVQNRISAPPVFPPGTAGGNGNVYAGSAIGQLSNVAINNPTITGTLSSSNIPALQSLNGLLGIGQGGTGTSTAPGADKLLLSDANGNWEYAATSSLGFSTVTSLSALTDVALSTSSPPAFGDLLEYTGSNWINLATSSLGIVSLPYYASSTIGNGTASGGLTISGNATTTGSTNLEGSLAVSGNAYFGGNVGIGTTSPNEPLTIQGDTENILAESKTSGESSYMGYNDTNGDRFLVGIDGEGFGNFAPGAGLIATWSDQPLLFATDQAERMRITSAGTVGIGTTTPWGKLSITGADTSAATPALAIANSNNTALLDVMDDGQIGIGTASPDSELTIQGNGNIPLDWGSTSPIGYLSYSGSNAVVRARNALIFDSDLNNDRMIIDSSGNVGIGTTTPGSLLSLGSTNGINFSTATSTFNSTGGINIANGCFSVDGTCVGNGASSQWTTSGSAISYASGDVGIGTTSPRTTLQVSAGGSGVLPQVSSIAAFESSSNGYISILTPDNAENGILFGSPTGSNEDAGIIYNNNANLRGLTFRTGGNQTRMVIDSSGNVGIGTTSPSANLAVAGNAYVTGNVTTGVLNLNPSDGNASDAGQLNFYNGAGALQGYIEANNAIQLTTTDAWAHAGVGNFEIDTNVGTILMLSKNATDVALTARGATSQTADLFDAENSSGNVLFDVGASGNVGIGTTTPYSLLTLSGGSTGNAFEIDSSASAASTTVMTVSNAGLVSIGDDVGGSSGIFTVDASSSTTTISNLSIGNLEFDTDAGIVNLSDIPVDSNAASGVQEAQVINIGGNPVFTASGISNGEGGVTNLDVGIGTTTNPYATLEVWGPDAASSTPSFTVVNNASTTLFAVFDGGNAQLAGTLTQNSDQRLKTNVQTLNGSSTLVAVLALNPVTYNWIDTDEGTTPQMGFIAQQVQTLFPYLVSTTSPTALTPDGTLGVNYIGFIPAIVSAIQQIATEVEQFAQSITTQLLAANEVDTQKLCVGDVCVTQQQFLAMVAAANQSSIGTPDGNAGSGGGGAAASDDSSTSDSTSSPQTTPPQITVLGNNPATVEAGTSYEDLGAQIVSPQQDLNLGIEASVDGGATTSISDISIDTSQPGMHTIIYTATDQNGLVGTAQRTVNVVAPSDTDDSSASSTPPTDDASSTPPTNDASSTDATSTQP